MSADSDIPDNFARWRDVRALRRLVHWPAFHSHWRQRLAHGLMFF
jgi:hypothetical protein